MSRAVEQQGWLKPWVVPWLVSGGIFCLVAFTASHYGVTWDEPPYFYASDLEIQWFADFGKNLLRGNVTQSLQDNVIETTWRWDPLHVPHPPFSRLLSGLTKAVFSPFIDKVTAYRLAPALLFSLLVAVMYLWMTEIFDSKTGLFSALTLLLMPNLFAQAHFAVTDVPLTTLWFLTLYCFVKGLKNWKWSIALGIVWGLALATKFPALLLPIPLLLWTHLYHRKAYTNNVFAMVFLSPVVMIGCQPYLWHRTPARILEFVLDGVNRGHREEAQFLIFFFNKIHLTHTLPWYYTSFMTAVTIPETILLLLFTGLIVVARLKPQREIMLLFLLNAAFILSMGLVPGAVLHDVNRLMLPVLPYVTGLASCGFFVLVRYLTERCQTLTALRGIKQLRGKLIGSLFVLLLFPPALDLVTYHPYELSYYNRLVGGIRGAYQKGLEVTYFMEAFTPDFLQYLNEMLPPNAAINAAFGNGTFAYYQMENRLRRDIQITDTLDFDYYILLNRQSAFSTFQRGVSKSVRPYASWNLSGVPLIFVYKK